MPMHLRIACCAYIVTVARACSLKIPITYPSIVLPLQKSTSILLMINAIDKKKKISIKSINRSTSSARVATRSNFVTVLSLIMSSSCPLNGGIRNCQKFTAHLDCCYMDVQLFSESFLLLILIN